MDNHLARIADALERLSPPPPAPADPRAHAAYVWRDATLGATRAFAPVALDRLRGIDAQKTALVDNLARLAHGSAAHDVLLWGARGSGKSALVKSAVAQVQANGGDLALIEVGPAELASLPRLFVDLADVGRAWLVFIDDLGFDTPREGRTLRSLLDGGAEARPATVRLAVTANRRHLVPRDMAEQASAINPRDAIDDSLALADRFGLSLGFPVIDQDIYLEIVAGYAAAHGLAFDQADAVGFAARRGGRSGRVAWHYIVDLAGRQGRSLSADLA